MAYLSEEKETIELDFPLSIVWQTIKKAVAGFEWIIEASDESNHCIQAKTEEVCFLAYATVLLIEVKAVSEKVSLVTIYAKTPVTTITSVNFAKNQGFVNSFLRALSTELLVKK